MKLTTHTLVAPSYYVEMIARQLDYDRYIVSAVLTIHVETPLCFKVQAKAKLVILPPNFSATAVNFLTFSILALPSGEVRCLTFSSMAPFKLLWYLEPSGIPSLYFPVKRPESSGDQIVLKEYQSN